MTASQGKEQIPYTGFLAQDVEKVAKRLNYHFSVVDAAKNQHDLYGLGYAEFVVPLKYAQLEIIAAPKPPFIPKKPAFTEMLKIFRKRIWFIL
ncbi:MAG TPA: hypothetical protein VEV83_19890 [Parafilimonas sp.]|nr:hypothetical protein [Parafilimonas sp.]